MKTPKCLLLLITGFIGISTSSSLRASGPVKVFLLAGQSNMVGYGRIETGVGDVVGAIGSLRYQIDQDPDHYGHLVDESGDWIVRDDVWVWARQSEYIYQPPGDRDRFSTGHLTAGFGHDSHAARTALGPELGFGSIAGDFHDEQVVLVKAAWGAASLAVHFRPPSAVADRGGEIGPYYNLMLTAFEDAMVDIAAQFPGQDIEIAGFGWHQGWSDRINQSHNNEYEENLADFIVDVRNALGVPNLPFVIAETGHGGIAETDPLALSLMAAQASMVDEEKYPEFAGNVGFIDTQEFWREVGVSPRNVNFHWNENGETYYLIGEAMGEAMTLLLPAREPAGSLAVYQNFDPSVSNRSDLVGPAGGAGECWNQTMTGEHLAAGGFSGENLVDFMDRPTGVSWSLKRSDDGSFFEWLGSESASLSMLHHGVGTNSNLVCTLSITGLDSAKTYDLYLTGYGAINEPWTEGDSFANQLTFSTTYTTTTSGPQQMTQTGQSATWVPNDNYVAFKDMVPDAAGTLAINSTKQSPLCFWSGFQLIETPAHPVPEITAFRITGEGVWELTLEGAADTNYEFVSSLDLNFETNVLITSLSQVSPENDPGIISGSTVLTTDENGKGTVRMTLGGNPVAFVRAQIPTSPAANE